MVIKHIILFVCGNTAYKFITAKLSIRKADLHHSLILLALMRMRAMRACGSKSFAVIFALYVVVVSEQILLRSIWRTL